MANNYGAYSQNNQGVRFENLAKGISLAWVAVEAECFEVSKITEAS